MYFQECVANHLLSPYVSSFYQAFQFAQAIVLLLLFSVLSALVECIDMFFFVSSSVADIFVFGGCSFSTIANVGPRFVHFLVLFVVQVGVCSSI